MARNSLFTTKTKTAVYISPLLLETVVMPHLDMHLMLYTLMVYDMGLRSFNLLKLTYGDLTFASSGYIRMPKNRDVNVCLNLSVNVQSLIVELFIGRHSSDEYLFSDKAGKRWSATAVAHAFDKVSKKACTPVNEDSLYYSWCCNVANYTFGGKNPKKAKKLIDDLLLKRSSLL